MGGVVSKAWHGPRGKVAVPILLTVCIVLSSTATGQAVVARSSGMPKVLLAAPVNATWAANSVEHWRAKGIDGFLFEGLRDGLAPPKAVSSGEEARLLAEIRAAQARLADSGVGHNFLRLPFSPEAPYFARPSSARQGVEAIRKAAAFCNEAGLRGIALEVLPESLIYQYRWDGYFLDETPAAALEEGARRFGRQAIRACLRAFPEGEILLIIDPFPPGGPLWHALFQGMLEGPGAAKDVPIRVLVGESAGILSVPGREVDALDRATAWLTARCTPEQRGVWTRQGAICLGLEPIGYRQGLPVLSYAIEYFRARLCMAKALSETYAWINAPNGGWWEVMPDEVNKYDHLAQGGAAAVLPTPPVPPQYKDFVLHTPVDGFLRVGPGGIGEDRDGFVLRDGQGAALLLPRGLPQGYVMPLRSGTLPLTNLYTGTRHEIAPESEAALVPPIDGPLLLERLPIVDYVLPTCLWMEVEDRLTAGKSRGYVAFGLENRTGDALRGNLEAFGAEGYSVGTASFPIRLEPGEAVTHRRAVQGIFHEGDSPSFRLLLALDGGGNAARDFILPVRPAERWARFLDASARVAPELLLDSRGMLEAIAVVGGSGGLWLLDGNGKVIRVFLDEMVVTRALAGRGVDGMPLLTAFGARGEVMAVDARGEIRWRRALDHERGPEAGVVMAGDTDLAVMAFPDGSLEAIPFDDSRGWRRGMSGAITHLTRVGDLLMMAVQTADRNTLVCMDGAGGTRWEAELPSALTCPPVLLEDTPSPTLAVALADGALAMHNPETGEAQHTSRTGLARPHALAGLPGSGGLLLVLTDDGATVCTPEGSTKWTAEMVSHTLVKTVDQDHPIVADGEGGLYLGQVDGLRKWSNPPAHGILACPPISLPTEHGAPPQWLLCFSDASVRLVAPQTPAPSVPEAPKIVPEQLSMD